MTTPQQSYEVFAHKHVFCQEQKELGELQTFQKLEEVVTSFKAVLADSEICFEPTQWVWSSVVVVVVAFVAAEAGVPLIQQLKSDAIRKGHWEELMTMAEVETAWPPADCNPFSVFSLFSNALLKIGSKSALTEEDFDIKKMTLNAVFAMQLHRFPDEVNELVVTVPCHVSLQRCYWRVWDGKLKPNR